LDLGTPSQEDEVASLLQYPTSSRDHEIRSLSYDLKSLEREWIERMTEPDPDPIIPGLDDAGEKPIFHPIIQTAKYT
jgi:hypothetical protein